MHNIADNIRLERLGYDDGKSYGDYYTGETIQFIFKCAEEMITEGYLKEFVENGRRHIRSLNKTEQKVLNRFKAEMQAEDGNSALCVEITAKNKEYFKQGDI